MKQCSVCGIRIATSEELQFAGKCMKCFDQPGRSEAFLDDTPHEQFDEDTEVGFPEGDDDNHTDDEEF